MGNFNEFEQARVMSMDFVSFYTMFEAQNGAERTSNIRHVLNDDLKLTCSIFYTTCASGYKFADAHCVNFGVNCGYKQYIL